MVDKFSRIARFERDPVMLRSQSSVDGATGRQPSGLHERSSRSS